jgi:hypothetical protein
MLSKLRGFVRTPSPATVMAFVAMVLAAGGFAFAAIPDSKGVIHGCYQKKKGTLRVVSSESKCKKKREKAISWNQKGATGGPGIQGAQGVAGKNAATSITIRTFLANFAGNGTLGEAGATCNAGEKLIGGGGGWVDNANPATSYQLSGTVSDSSPASIGDAPIAEGDTPDEWHVSGRNTTGANARMLAYAVCAAP